MKYLIAILPIFIMLTLAPALMAVPNNAYAQNKAIQSISQIQGATQLGICLSGIDTFISCNNLNLQNQINTGDNALAQDGGNGKYSGNSAVQAIGQEQSSDQVAVCISAEGTFLSCNNLNLQNQINTGSNLALQNGGNGKYSGNSAVQAIGQEQSSSQRALVLSGGDIDLSGNNLNVQNQINTGSNALAQDGGNSKGSGNSAAQGIGQSQSSSQSAGCVSGGDVSQSCNNLNIQNQINTGSNALAQDGGNGKGSGNSAAQGIGQSQSSSQRSQCVAGGSLDNSCNNLSFQNQVNTGSNAAAQSGGNGKGSGNSAAQGIGQSQSSSQRSQCVSGGDVSDSCNNLNIQNQINTGSNALAQDGGNGKGSGNSAAQGIGQSQSSSQRSQCVAGGSLDNSCNNLSFQNQVNTGSNAAAQSGGNSKGSGNSAAQGIGQSQSSSQNAQCVSGEDAIVSCNNVEFQNQVNSGSNALAQFGLDNNGNQGGARHGGNSEGSGNSAAQGIGQSQDSSQRSSVFSAGDSFLSGNNLNLQNQNNEGDNLAAQSSEGNGDSTENTGAQNLAQTQGSGDDDEEGDDDQDVKNSNSNEPSGNNNNHNNNNHHDDDDDDDEDDDKNGEGNNNQDQNNSVVE
ncbi:hypothetical protein [Candidatus Nitrosocosmicus sp. SS]|jgi:hypothetical protein|uniref:hypothetical protein n=1 Tax=Candidatus Nitrosocosmicus agrestis TaxID=2563600 RepID=UPI00122E4720|nr:hypothetical protein [Candidatus Nitrosocosmicus sp. SS]KAA2283403.1 hypothetical protein F1Z66_02600 [Candidatus Nitrosocosmicus sp. SS]KAF0868951.1 hypothetical protein E5N71_08130 [Candidatus Nitrosocosmicus sp. SS]